MKNIPHQHNNNDIYQKFVNKISQVAKYDKSSINQQNRSTMNSDMNESGLGKYQNQNNPQNNEPNDLKEQQSKIYEKMNQHLLNRRRNAEWGKNQNNTTNINVKGQEYANQSEIIQNKQSYEINNKNTGTFGPQKNSSINNHYQYQYQNINQQNDNNNYFNQSHHHHAININYSNNSDNINNPFKTNINNSDNFQNNNSVNYQNQNNSKNLNQKGYDYKNNQFQNKILENSNNNNKNYKYQNNIEYNSNNNNQSQNENVLQLNNLENPNEPKKSRLCPSLLYGLIFGSFGTLLYWCRNPKVREYLKNCYHNINIESIINFFKMFLHPMDLIQKMGNNIGSLGEILQQSIQYLYEFFEEYSDIWRLLGIILMVYIFWLIIKIIIGKIIKRKNNQKKGNKNQYKVQFIQ